MKLDPLLKTELEKLQKNFEKKLKEIKDIFFGEGKKYQGKQNVKQLLEGYEDEKKLFRKYGCKDHNEMSDKLVKLQSALMNLNSILFYDKY